MRTTIDATIAGHARAQHGLVTREQLLSAGISRRTISRWVGDAALVRVGGRTYRLASSPATRMATVLAPCLDRGATASHLSAGWLQSLTPWRDVIDVTVRKGRPTLLAIDDVTTLRVHSSTNLPPDDVVVVEGIPTTNVARTLLGIAALVPDQVSFDELVDVIATVVETGRGSLGWLRWLLDERRCRGRNGVSALDAALEARVRMGPTESWLEREMVRLLDSAGLPRPALQRRVARAPGRAARVDFLYERERIVVEVLGYRFHRTPEQVDADTMRANELQIRGFKVLQFTARRLQHDPGAALDLVAAALAAAPVGRSPS